MYSSVANTTFSYALTLGKFRDQFKDPIKPSWVKITTITMVSKFDNAVDIKTIKTKLRDCGSIFVTTGSTTTEWIFKDTGFYNQITLYYKDIYSTKSVKLFPNGSVQVAGCHDLFDCKRVITNLTAVVNNLSGVENVPIEDFRVVMINTNFSTNYHLNLHELVKHFSSNPIFNVSFDPDRYSAVKIKFKPGKDMKYVTVSVFCTGRVIITGAENLKEIAYTYNIINHHITNHPSIKVQPVTDLDIFDTFCGYNIDELRKYLHDKGFRPWGYTQCNYKINF